MPAHAHRMSGILEPLEPRLLLAAFELGWQESSGQPGGIGNSGTGDPADFIDAGDLYWYCDEQIHLFRAKDQLVVRLANGAHPEVIMGLLAGGAPAAAFSDYVLLDPNTLVVKSASPSDDIAGVLGLLRSSPAVDWAGPSFACGETWDRIYVTDQVGIALKPGVDPSQFFARFEAYRQLFMNQYVVTVEEGGLAALERANALRDDPAVLWAEANFYGGVHLTATPDDTLYANQWNLDNTGQTGASTGADADVDGAWETTVGSDQVVIAIIDSGVDIDHPDLQDNIYQNADEVNGNTGVDDDDNGYIDDCNGWDFTSAYPGDNDPSPSTSTNYHGTAVAGVAAARGNNDLGVTGVSQRAKILPVKIAEDDQYGEAHFILPLGIAQAIYYAGGYDLNGNKRWEGADIINCSWRMYPPSSLVTSALNFVSANGRGGLGVPIFVSSGNWATGYKEYVLPSIAAGNWRFRWRYAKDASGSGGEDAVWLANVALPDGTHQRFAGPGLPTGWTTQGNALWTVATDVEHAYFTDLVGGEHVRSGAVGDNQVTDLISPVVTTQSEGSLTFQAWISTEKDHDFLYLDRSSDGGLTWPVRYIIDSGIPSIEQDVAYPANLASTIAVGASTDWDRRAAYSQYGPELDFVAPSGGGYAGITTTDLIGAAGKNHDGDYTSTDLTAFSGTSASAPLAAGIAALLLSKNPGLTADLVRSIMRSTANKVGSEDYANGFNEVYGYGRVNAYVAINAFGPNITAEIAGVSPDPRATSVSSISITFTEAVANFGLEDLSLTRDGVSVSLTGATLANPNQDRIHWTLSGLGVLTARAGKYSLKLTAEGSLITGDGGDYLAGNAVEEWLMDTITGTSGADTVTLSGSAAQVVTTGDNYAVDLGDFATDALYFMGGDGTDKLIVELANGNPVPAGTVQFDGEDGEEDELQILGTAGADSVTQKLGQVLIDSALINYTTDVERVWVVLEAGNDTLTLDYTSELGVPTGGIMFEPGAGYDTLWIYLPDYQKLTLSAGGEPGVGGTIAWDSDLEKMCVVCAAEGPLGDTLAVDYAEGDPLPSDGVAFYGGTGNDRVKILGSETEDETLVLTSGQVQMNSYPAVTYDEDVERIWAALRTGTNNVEVNGDLGHVALFLSGEEGGGLCTLTAADPAYTDEVDLVLCYSAIAEFDSSLSLASLDLQADTQATLTLGGKMLVTTALNIAESSGLAVARLDITDGSLVVDYTGGANPYADVQGWIIQAWNNGEWDSNGITSSSAGSDPYTYAVGVADNNSPDMLYPYGDGDPYPLFGNVTPVAVNPESVLVKFTYIGDIDLNGQVDENDLNLLLGWYDNDPESPTYTSHQWYTGDIWGYDAICDENDLNWLLGNYGMGVGDPL